MLVRLDGGVALERAGRVRGHEAEGLVEPCGCGGGVVQAVRELDGDGLRPDGARDGVAKGGAEVVGCEVEARDDGDVWGVLGWEV